MIRRLIVPLTAAVVTVHAGQVLCAGRVSGATAQPERRTRECFAVSAGERRCAVGLGRRAVGVPVAGRRPGFRAAFSGPPPQASGAADACMKGFVPLREEAEKRGKLIKAASDRKAPPDEACKLIKNFGQAELKMIAYVQTNSAKCGIPPQIADQLKNGHKNTEKMQNQVCNVAQQAQARGPAGPSLSEVLGSSAALPEAQAVKKGGSTFDTLNGNVLTR